MSVQMLINLTVGDVGQKEAANWVCVQYLSVPHPPDAVMVSSHLHSTEILMDLIKGRLKKKNHNDKELQERGSKCTFVLKAGRSHKSCTRDCNRLVLKRAAAL